MKFVLVEMPFQYVLISFASLLRIQNILSHEDSNTYTYTKSYTYRDENPLLTNKR